MLPKSVILFLIPPLVKDAACAYFVDLSVMIVIGAPLS